MAQSYAGGEGVHTADIFSLAAPCIINMADKKERPAAFVHFGGKGPLVNLAHIPTTHPGHLKGTAAREYNLSFIVKI